MKITKPVENNTLRKTYSKQCLVFHSEMPFQDKTVNLKTDLFLFTKINSMWITCLNVKCKMVKLLEDNMEENLDDLVYSDDF